MNTRITRLPLRGRLLVGSVTVIALLGLLTACGEGAASPTPTPSPTPAAQQSPTPTGPADNTGSTPTPTLEATPTEAPAPISYEGKTIRIVVNWPAGSSADIFGRLIAHHLKRFVDGDPNIVVVNRAGASGLVGAMSVYNARPDGTTLGVFSAVNAGNQMTRPGWDYDMRDARILLGFQGQTSMWYIRGDAPYDRLQDAVGQGSAGGPRFSYGTSDICTLGTARERAVKEWLDLPVDIKYGFEANRAAVWLSLERNDYESGSSSGWYTLPIDRPGWLTDGFVEPFAIVNPKGTAHFEGNAEMDLPSDLMYVSELLTPEQEQLYRRLSADSLGPQHRAIHAPPGTPEEYVTYLRDVLWNMFSDDEFMSELVKLRGDDDPLDIRGGAEMEELVRDALSDIDGTLTEAQRFLPECELDIPGS